MSYNFNFNLSELPRDLFIDIRKYSEILKNNENIEKIANNLVKKYNLDEITGLSLNDSNQLIIDILYIMLINKKNTEKFQKTKNRALFLPHCCRKYMDSRCKAEFDAENSSYKCKHCSSDCIVNHTTKYAKDQNYDIFILPGASCVKRIVNNNFFDGIIGIACTDELKLSIGFLDKTDIVVQCIPLLKNGCNGTFFDFEDLQRIIKNMITISKFVIS